MKAKILADFQIWISVPLRQKVIQWVLSKVRLEAWYEDKAGGKAKGRHEVRAWATIEVYCCRLLLKVVPDI